MKIVFTKPTSRSTVAGFSKIDKLLELDDAVELSTKNLNVELVKFAIIEALLLSKIKGSEMF